MVKLLIDYFIKHKINIYNNNEIDGINFHILKAIKKNNSDIVEILLHYGKHNSIDVNEIINKKLRSKSYLLMEAIKKMNTKIIKLLIKSGANININDKEGNSPLDLIIMKNSIELIDYIYVMGFNFKEMNFNSLDYIIQNKNISLLKKLMKYGLKVDIDNKKVLELLNDNNSSERKRMGFHYTNETEEILVKKRKTS